MDLAEFRPGYDHDPVTDLPLDPLQHVTRQHRKALTVLSLIAIAYVRGVKPTQFTALGVTLGGPVLAFVDVWLWLSILYFLLTFLMYVCFDLWLWERSMRSKVAELLTSNPMTPDVAVDAAVDEISGSRWLPRLRLKAPRATFIVSGSKFRAGHVGLFRFVSVVAPVIWGRLLVEVGLPLLLCVCAFGAAFLPGALNYSWGLFKQALAACGSKW